MEWLNYHHLYYFWILHQEGSFTKAAKRLRISQSTVSEQIAQLESHLNVRLLDRSVKKRFAITEVGLSVIEYAQTIFEAGNELQRWLKSPDHRNTKIIRLGVQSGLSRSLQIDFLKPVLNKPDHRIHVVAGDQERLLQLLNEYKIDIILMSSALDERFPVESYAHALTSTRVCVVSSKPAREKNFLRLLENASVYLPTSHFEIRVQIDAFFDRHKLKPNIVGEVDDVTLLRLLALSTDALVFIPRLNVDEDIKRKDLHEIHEFKDIKKRYYAITRQRKFPNPLTEYLIRSMKPE